jgi:hypothetical protein
MNKLIDLGLAVEETRSTYFSAQQEDGAKKLDSTGQLCFATANISHQVPEANRVQDES